MDMELRSGKTAAWEINPQANNGLCVPCKRRKVEKPNIYLPREVLFNILLLLPANLLEEVVRYVCKQWYDIVSDPCFIRVHCQMPTPKSDSFIIQSRCRRHEFYRSDQDVAKSVKLTTIQLPFRAKLLDSCNGLGLFLNCSDMLKLHLLNPLTKRMVSLPPVVIVELVEPISLYYSFAVSSSGQYKAVHFAMCIRLNKYEMNVCTIGVDKSWRPIHLHDQRHLDMRTNHETMTITLVQRALFVAGFLYWGTHLTYCLAMDVDTEIFYRISWPRGIDRFDCESHFLSMGTAIGLMTQDDINKRGTWTFRKLTDFKSSKWTKITMIDIVPLFSKVSNGTLPYSTGAMRPISMIDGEFCFYVHVDLNCSWVVRYYLADQSFVSFLVNKPFLDSFSHYVPTLIPPKTTPSK